MKRLVWIIVTIFSLLPTNIFAQSERKVICIGETVMDIVFRGHQPLSANAGGSALNSAVSLGRAHAPVTFIGEVGNDSTGMHILSFLQQEHVDARLTVRPNMRTTVSTAYLDNGNNAHYTFFADQPDPDRSFDLPEINKDDILLFGSFFAANPANNRVIEAILDSAQAVGAIVYYDINLRKPHAWMLPRLMPNIERNMSHADIVRGSKGDISTVWGSNNAENVYASTIAPACKNFICTRGAKPISVYAVAASKGRKVSAEPFSATYPVPQIKTVSTIGAGDNFNAGFCYGLLSLGITKKDLARGLSARQWQQLIDYAQLFSQDCCKHLGNYISTDLLK